MSNRNKSKHAFVTQEEQIESKQVDGCQQGEQGEIGENGNKGEQGQRGEQGEQGQRGEQGEQGEQGNKGEQGQRGENGNKGERGEQGEQGDKGEQGERGEQGDKGEQGERGEQGEQGNKGEQGERGERGQQGEQGNKGEQGERGERGGRGGRGFIKSILYNSGITLKNTFSNIITLPYNGLLYKLDNCNIVISSKEKTDVTIKLFDITNTTEKLLVEYKIISNGVQVCEISEFNLLKNQIYALQFRGKSEKDTTILSLEFNMN